MDHKQETTQRIEHIADDTLKQFERVADAARSALRSDHVVGLGTLANVNTFTSTAAMVRLDRINQENRDSASKLADEPAIARVAFVDESGKIKRYYFCRADQGMANMDVISYLAPIGRMASLSVGDEFRLPGGSIVEVIESAKFRPFQAKQGWDSRDSIIEVEEGRPLTIESLRALLHKVVGEELAEDLLGQLFAEESQATNVFEGIRRSVITKMELRDQPILDKYQDEIFRLPLDKRLLILGPPGTGKTTTLIRRLGQKVSTAFLEEDERNVVESLAAENGVAHDNSWLMFTPTELLKQYLKEAFSREGVPASDLRIRTWFDYRRELARNTFGVLRTSTGGGSFVLKDTIEPLTPDALDHSIAWFSDFDDWQRTAFINELRQSAQVLSENQTSHIAVVGQRLLAILQRATNNSLTATFSSLVAEISGIQSLVGSLKGVTDKKIHGALNLQLNRNKDVFIDELAKFIDALQQTPEAEADDLDDQDADDEEANTPRTGRAAAAAAYMQAIRAQARAQAGKRSLGKNTRNGKIIEWLGDRGLNEGDRAEVGASLLVQASARRFVNPLKRYLDGIPRRYRAFRRQRQEEGKWYRKESFTPTDLHPLELDGVLLAILRGANELLSRSTIVRDIDQPAWTSLKPILDLYKNQILVDEATDFSPIQLACMAALAHPRLRSFFACGDFNQRLTTWGSRSLDEMKWVFPGIEVKEITVSYRQSRQLNELARAIILVSGGADQIASLPEHVKNEGVAPTLLEGVSELDPVVDWLAQRIREIERFVGQLPSIAIFVESESEVQPVADALNAALADENAQVVACPKGQVMGQDNDVRVFDVQHIKGLEFEAVFFIGIDRLASLHPQLFDKYLYVGTTRAATYLGVTCDDALPVAISSLRPMFVADWKNP
ncbi:MAG: ATP-binding domain-containing protein [Pseudomonadota bacterium]|nr:ATP-binding domain-containing protein [Pseudomonadota bacterium]